MYVNTGRWSKTYTCMLTQVGGVKCSTPNKKIILSLTDLEFRAMDPAQTHHFLHGWASYYFVLLILCLLNHEMQC